MQLVLIFIIGLLASFVGQLFTGTGLISVPLLISIGVPPHLAIASHKIGTLGMSVAAFRKYLLAKKIIWRLVLPLTVIGIVGSLIGVSILVSVNKGVLSKLIGILILLMLPVIFRKGVGVHKKEANPRMRSISFVLYFLVAVWGGFFGGGAGILFSYIYIAFFGLTFLEWKGTNKIPHTIINLIAVVVLALNGYFNLLYAIILFVSMSIGSYLGAHIALKKGDAYVKAGVGVVIILSSIKLIFF